MATAIVSVLKNVWVQVDPFLSLQDSTEKGSTSTRQSTLNQWKTTDVVHDIVLGLADGLTVPFALTAGLSSLGSSRLVITGGLAEIISGAISMGLGGYLAAKAACDSYAVEAKKTAIDSCQNHHEIKARAMACLQPYIKISDIAAIQPFVETLVNENNKPNLAAFLLRFESGLEPVDIHRPWKSAITIAFSYIIGGLIPMIPYFILSSAQTALFVSIAITCVILLIFGYVKNVVTCPGSPVASHMWSALQTLVVGAIAAGAAYGLVLAIGNPEDPL